MTRKLTVQITADEAAAIEAAAEFLSDLADHGRDQWQEAATELEHLVDRIHATADGLTFPDPAQEMAQALADGNLILAQEYAPVVSALALDAIADAIALPTLDT